MADISTWSPVDESNTAAPPAGWPENMQPSAVNNSARGMMGAIRRWYDTVTAQLASLTTALGNYVLKSGDTMTGTLSAPAYNLSGIPFASSDGTTSHIFDGSGGNAIHLQAVLNYYDADTHTFRNSNGATNLATIDVAGVTLVGNLIHFAGSGGTINATGGPLLFADASNHVYKQGSGNGSFLFQNYAGTSVAAINSGGGIAAATISVTGTITAATMTASGEISAGGNLHAGTSLFLGGPYILFNNNANLSQGPFSQVNNTDWIQRLGAGAGRWYFETSAGSIVASIDAAGNVYSPLYQGQAGGGGALKGIPTADPTSHSISFGWDGVSSVFYRNIDGSRTDTIPWSDTIRAFLLAADGGTPSGWRLGVYSGGAIFNIYVDFTASDARMKRGIADSEVDALTALCSVPVRKFEWLDEIQETFGVRQGPVEIGLVAQELLPYMPDVVGISEGRGAPYPDDTHTLMYDRIHAYTIRAIQQLSAENAALAARVAALEEAHV